MAIEKKTIISSYIKRSALSTLLIGLCTLFSFSQEKTILSSKFDLKIKSQPIYEALTELSSASGYNFTYKSDLLKADSIVDLQFRDKELQFILDSVFQNHLLKYKIIEDQIVIYQPPNNDLEIIHQINVSIAKQIILTGKVVNEQSREALQYANVAILGKSIGTTTNKDGYFSLRISESEMQDELVVNYIGLKPWRDSVKNCLTKKYLDVKLKPDLLSIQEVIIRRTSPISIVHSCIEKIQENYHTEPVLLNSFYREGARVRNSYTRYSEALLNVYKSSYANLGRSDQVEILKSRKMKKLKIKDSIDVKLKAGLRASLWLDVIKSKPDFLDPAEMHRYSYVLEDITTYDEKPVYKIAFSQKRNTKEPLYQGVLFIDIESLALIHVEFELNPKQIKKARKSLVIKTSRKIRVYPVNVKYRVSYRKHEGKYYLNHVRGDLHFSVKSRKKIFRTHFNTFLELAISDVQTEGVRRIQRKRRVKLDQVFTDNTAYYDNKFWSGYNYISPEIPIQKAIEKLRMHMQKEIVVPDFN